MIFFIDKIAKKNHLKNDKKWPPFFGSFLWPFLTPFFGGTKNGQKMAQKPKIWSFFAKNGKKSIFSLFFPPRFLPFLRFRIPPCLKFLGGVRFWPPKNGHFWAIFWVKIIWKSLGFPTPQKNGQKWPFLGHFLGFAEPQKMGTQKNGHFWPFFAKILAKGGMKNREKRVLKKCKILKKFYNFFL